MDAVPASEASIADEARPLAGLAVVEVSQVLAGAFACQVLSDLGASVVKIERPGIGDPSRGYGPPFVDESAYYFHSLNRNKRSIAVALDTDPGRDILMRLGARSDVLVHNLLPVSARSLGLDPEALHAANPDLVFASVSAYGDIPGMDGKPALDMLTQAMGGSMSLTGFGDGPPVKSAVPIADIAAGLFTAIGALAVLVGKRDGRMGSDVTLETSLMRSVVASLPFHWGECVVDGTDPTRRGNGHPSIVPYNTFPAGDGHHVAIAVSSDLQWRRFRDALGLTPLPDDGELADNRGRVGHRAAVEEEIAHAFGALDSGEIVRRLEAAGIPVALVNSALDVVERSTEDGWNVFGPLGGDGALVARPPVRVGGADVDLGSAPALGEHSLEVLAELGFGDREARDLVEAGVVEVPASRGTDSIAAHGTSSE